MARSSVDGDEEDEVVRWQKLVELGAERGLREAGLSQESMDKVLSFVDKEYMNCREVRHTLSDIEDGMAMLLAFYGRGSEGKACRLSLDLDQGFQINENEATALCVNMACNTSITSLRIWGHQVFGIDQKIFTLFVNALKTNFTLIELSFNYIDIGFSEAVRYLMDGLRANKHLPRLSLCGVPLLDEGIKFVVDFLCSNTSLISLNLTATGYGYEGAKLLSYALDHNITLLELILGKDHIGRDGIKKLLEPLSRDTTISSDGPKNTTLKSLRLLSMSRESFCVDSVAWMVKVNKTLTFFAIFRAPLTAEELMGKIFPALTENKTLKVLDIRNCTGLDSEEVRSAFMSLIKEGKIGLEEIYLENGTWEAQVQEELRINKAYRDKLRGQSMAAPTSRRIILCGREFSGKTTIRNTMESTVQGTPWCHPFNMAYKRFMRTFPHLRQLFFGTDSHKELAERTRGFDILVFKEKPRTSMWDFAGQKEYYALHDYMFPSANNSFFLYVSSCRCPPTDSDLYGKVLTEKKMKDDFSYWLRFVASNSKRGSTLNEVKDGEDTELPHVKFVLTNIDTLAAGKERANSIELAERVVAELREQFKSVIELSEDVAAVNAHNAADVKHLILQSVCPKLEKIVEKQRVYKICEEVQSALDTWSKTDSSTPVVSLEEFHKICQEQKKLTLDEEVQEGVLAYLNDMGEIIYPKGLDFVVVNPRWFGTNILGYLIDAFEGASQRRCWISNCIFGHSEGPPLPCDDGIITRNYVKRLLDFSLETMNVKESIGVSVERLVQLMILLEMCFEEDPRNKNSRLFLPALFDDKEDKAGRGERKLEWSPRGGKLVYLGRRLQCEDESTTFLTPGFFPRLQVHLLQYMRENKWTKKEGFEIGRNLIRFTEKGHDICIEYSGNVGYFIDIMVRSSMPFAKALQFIEEHVIKKVHLFCAKVCKRVELVEAVVRPACVQRLRVCVERKAHSVLVSTLRDADKEDPECLHTWEQSIPNVLHTDRAFYLLKGEPSECSSSATSACSVGNLPDFYLKPEPGFWTNLTKRMSVARLKPFKLHLFCSENKHEVEGQPGRTITLPGDSRFVFSILAPVIKTLWNKFGLGVNIDKGIEAIFDGGDIYTIDIKTIQRLQRTTENPMKTLEEYIHFTGSLKHILKDLYDKRFWEDFRLRQVSGKIGWYCDDHFQTAWNERDGSNRTY